MHNYAVHEYDDPPGWGVDEAGPVPMRGSRFGLYYRYRLSWSGLGSAGYFKALAQRFVRFHRLTLISRQEAYDLGQYLVRRFADKHEGTGIEFRPPLVCFDLWGHDWVSKAHNEACLIYLNGERFELTHDRLAMIDRMRGITAKLDKLAA